ncbi:hypothetical protein VC83_03360 [Pseudogymnoascus destructans]|uniref:Uncharacterized protein n=1 Tax=Pseudogymnoascus destructans TaxID=655981 RepID=A0A177AGX6_9PEZI|nr:uncharacterized protein VC83_03360 [Pseudogymnoascus destructans]OAF60463.1 hypothetical protein VC83_03360 [Pseudogymnoascus destructans]
MIPAAMSGRKGGRRGAEGGRTGMYGGEDLRKMGERYDEEGTACIYGYDRSITWAGDGSVVNSFHHQHVLPPPRVHLIPPPLSALFAARCAVCRTTISGGLPPPSPDILSRLCSVPKTFEHLATIANNAMMASGPNARLFLKDSDMAKGS